MEPAFSLVTGDLSERGELESYSRLMDLVAEVEDEGYPVLLAMGNHDVRDNFYRVFKGRHCDDEKRYCYTSNVGGLRVVVLDSLVQGRGHERRGAWPATTWNAWTGFWSAERRRWRQRWTTSMRRREARGSTSAQRR